MDLNHFLHKTNLNEEEEGWGGGAENTIRSLKFKKAEKKFSFYFSFAKAKMYRASFKIKISILLNGY